MFLFRGEGGVDGWLFIRRSESLAEIVGEPFFIFSKRAETVA